MIPMADDQLILAIGCPFLLFFPYPQVFCWFVILMCVQNLLMRLEH